MQSNVAALRAHPCSETAAQIVDAMNRGNQVEDRRLVGRTMAEIGTDGFRQCFAPGQERRLQFLQVILSLSCGGRVVAQETRALPGEEGCQMDLLGRLDMCVHCRLPLVSRFRSSLHLAAHSMASFGIERTLPSY